MYDVKEKSLRTLQHDLKTGAVTSEELVFAYMQRIADFDQSGPELRSVLEINPDAIDIAAALDRERKTKGSRGPLHGIPVLVKDNISTGDRMHTSAGAESLKDNFAADDAEVIRQLREAGAVILGKTNLSEFARFMAMVVPNGYSARGGQCKSPYGEDVDPLGSSTGSGVAASMSFAAVTVGTETSGSIISPSSANSVVGLKPTVGLISRSGIIPINYQDTAGPMGRCIEDIAILLGAMCSEDPDDPATQANEGLVFEDYTQFLKKDALKGKRVGISRVARPWYSKEQLEVFEKSLKHLEEAGAVLVDGCDLPEVVPAAGFLTAAVMHFEFKRYMDAWLADYCTLNDIRTLEDIVKYNQAHAETAIKYGQDILEACAATSGNLTESDYLHEKVRVLRESRSGIDALLKEKELDVIVCPGPSAIVPTAGYPILSVPAGMAEDGRPMGLSFVGSAYSEPQLLAYGYAFEQVSQLRVIPKIG
ncbi:MAG: hypothetical protein IKF46_06330 [Erysipelotrichaceae bacterium]|nr:hypothetical protein [Erysipelotrichaceae bacterium]